MFTRFYNYMMYYTEEVVMANGLVRCNNVRKPLLNLVCGWLGLFITAFCSYELIVSNYYITTTWGWKVALSTIMAFHRILMYIFLGMGVTLLKLSNRQ